MLEDRKDLLDHLEQIHTTIMGEERIMINLRLTNEDVVNWCKEKIKDQNSYIYRRGKNWYIETNNCRITVNASSYTIITAHQLSLGE